ncbi:hypothetical protein CH252_15635, partial [Rhodococcus sp. 06-1477-1B]
MTWTMPAEGVRHERTWMAYPCEGYSLGDTPEEHHEARTTWADVAHPGVVQRCLEDVDGESALGGQIRACDGAF